MICTAAPQDSNLAQLAVYGLSVQFSPGNSTIVQRIIKFYIFVISLFAWCYFFFEFWLWMQHITMLLFYCLRLTTRQSRLADQSLSGWILCRRITSRLINFRFLTFQQLYFHFNTFWWYHPYDLGVINHHWRRNHRITSALLSFDRRRLLRRFGCRVAGFSHHWPAVNQLVTKSVDLSCHSAHWNKDKRFCRLIKQVKIVLEVHG